MADKHVKTSQLTMVALLSSIAFVIQYLDFPIPPFPTFLKVDFSEVPALFAGLMFGPWAGVIVQLLKNTLHYLFTGSEAGIPINQIANFIAGSIFVLLTVGLSRKISGPKGLLIGLSVATMVMALLMAVANYLIILPAYAYLINWTVQGPEKTALVLYGIAPFNLVKGLLIGVAFLPLYYRLKPKLSHRLSPR